MTRRQLPIRLLPDQFLPDPHNVKVTAKAFIFGGVARHLMTVGLTVLPLQVALLLVLIWTLLLPGLALGAQGGKVAASAPAAPSTQATQGAQAPQNAQAVQTAQNAQAAQTSPGSEFGGRRLVVVEGMDYYGQDPETRQDSDLEACQSACLANPRRRAFTYNRQARW